MPILLLSLIVMECGMKQVHITYFWKMYVFLITQKDNSLKFVIEYIVLSQQNTFSTQMEYKIWAFYMARPVWWFIFTHR